MPGTRLSSTVGVGWWIDNVENKDVNKMRKIWAIIIQYKITITRFKCGLCAYRTRNPYLKRVKVNCNGH